MLKRTIRDNLTQALKKGDEVACSTLRMLLAAILNKEKEKKYKEKIEEEAELTDEEVVEVISSEIKKRKEAILEFSAFAEGGEKDRIKRDKMKKKVKNFIKKEKAEKEVLEKYLPEQLSEEEIRKLAKEAIEEVGAKEIKDMGRVMAEIMPKVKGKADGDTVSKIVKDILAKAED